jgi:hypothetical protein
MRKKLFSLIVTLILALALGAFALATAAALQEEAAKDAPVQEEAAKDVAVQEDAAKDEAKEATPKCLDCHGPFDKLAEATANYQAPSGEIVTPHQYVPHEEKKDIPECTECHKPHEIPLVDKSTVVKPNNLDYCYQSCHHSNNFQPCSTCH